jgi:NitT/TauT family transport system substrate-binding protein
MAITLFENFRALFYAPFYAAHALGAYEAAGVRVMLKLSPDPAVSNAALRSGEADVAWGGPLRVLLAHDVDPASDLVCFCQVVARDPFFILGREPRPDFALGDLRGRRVGLVSEVPTPWLCLQDDLRRSGIGADAVHWVRGSSMEDNAAALRRGELDAAQMFQPHAELLLRAGDAHLWYAAASRGLTSYTSLNTRRSVLRSRPEELLAMTRAMAKTLNWLQSAGAEDVARAVADYFPQLDPALVAAAIARYQAFRLWGADPVLPREGFDRLKRAMLAGGAIRRDIPYEECVDDRLAAIAAGEASRTSASMPGSRH